MKKLIIWIWNLIKSIFKKKPKDVTPKEWKEPKNLVSSVIVDNSIYRQKQLKKRRIEKQERKIHQKRK